MSPGKADRRGMLGQDEGSLYAHVDKYLSGRLVRKEIGRLTARNQRWTLLSFARSFGNRPVARLGASDIERWLGDGCYTDEAQRTRFSVVRNFGRWLVRECQIAKDPCDGMRGPKVRRSVPRVFETDAVSELLDSCPDARARLIILLMVQEGLRCVEVSRLELGDIDSRNMLVRGKGGHERVLPLVGEVRDALDAYLQVRGGATGPLIQSYQHPGSGLARASISQYTNNWIRTAGLKRYRYDGRSAHGLRRTMATDMIDHGADVLDVKEALGHAELSTAQRYVKYRTERLGQAMGGRHYGDAHVVELRESG